ncbi:NAD-dependent 4,6-dehydratase LegB [Amycolatopsis endophytica]|uniref:UDP-glucose 4-epimerase n=1 Tax=Amycolatopsis endophytica TaxID=860233 RepID=A0A853AZQ7_9PSEU|nr:SDR family NAD(P)-dependent oxidoreductase [Amycolatopsis endophytica]NYI88105.1 UDP-glucose 4-epimerase [Amycolatopsis endophytica]
MSELTGKRVLVTGADGFIGSHLVERLVDEGVQVRALCVYNSNGSYGWLDELDARHPRNLDLRLGDIRDAKCVRGLVEDTDVVFHLAALIAIPYSYQAPASFVDTNVVGTLNVLEAARESNGPRVVNTSTSEVYGTPEHVPIRESHELRAFSPYAATKIAADKLCEAYARSFGIDVVTLRPFNTFGPRQSLRAVIPTILAQLLAGREVVNLGSVWPKRDFTYVADTVDGFLRTAVSDVPPGEVVQLGTGSCVSIGELFELCCEVTGASAEIESESLRFRPDAGEVEILLSDPSRAWDLISWKPATDLAEGLALTVEWMKPRVDHLRSERYHR